MLRMRKIHSWYVQNTFWIHYVHILGTFWIHSGYILETFCTHSGYILDAFWITHTENPKDGAQPFVLSFLKMVYLRHYAKWGEDTCHPDRSCISTCTHAAVYGVMWIRYVVIPSRRSAPSRRGRTPTRQIVIVLASGILRIGGWEIEICEITCSYVSKHVRRVCVHTVAEKLAYGL